MMGRRAKSRDGQHDIGPESWEQGSRRARSKEAKGLGAGSGIEVDAVHLGFEVEEAGRNRM